MVAEEACQEAITIGRGRCNLAAHESGASADRGLRDVAYSEPAAHLYARAATTPGA